MKNFLLIVLCFATIISCKKEEKKEDVKPIVSEVKVPEKKASKLKLKIQYKTQTEGIVQCVFNKIELEDNNQEGNFIVTEKLKADNKLHELSFKMFGDHITRLIQLRLGKKPKQIVFDNIILEYEATKVVINGKDLDKYFNTNKYIKYNSEASSLETMKIDGKHSPTLTLRQQVIKKLFGLNK